VRAYLFAQAKCPVCQKVFEVGEGNEELHKPLTEDCALLCTECFAVFRFTVAENKLSVLDADGFIDLPDDTRCTIKRAATALQYFKRKNKRLTMLSRLTKIEDLW
jgi:hypothetical protein